jgi:hypothetical protein
MAPTTLNLDQIQGNSIGGFNKDSAQAHACERLDGAPGFRAHGIGNGNRAEQPAVAGDKDLRCRLQPDHQGRRHRHVAIHHKRTVAHQEKSPPTATAIGTR